MITTPSKDQLRDKSFLLEYFRHRVEQTRHINDGNSIQKPVRKKTDEISKALKESRETIIDQVELKAQSENWSRYEIIDSILMITYTNYVVKIDSRNELWPYNYMDFSRKIGELWEPFCALAWKYPVKTGISFAIPPKFNDVKQQMTKELRDSIVGLKISNEEIDEIIGHNERVWSLVTSGEIKLELDLHFTDGNTNYNVDFKSGFGSNEKGNMNRLLLVASIYEAINENHKCEIYVRAKEESNNRYLQTLKNSQLWSVYCGVEAYERMEEHTGFEMKKWINRNISWEDDFDRKTISHLLNNNLGTYLKW